MTYIAAIGGLDGQDLNFLEAASRRADVQLVVAADVGTLMRDHVAHRGLPRCVFVPRQQDYRPGIDAIRDCGELFAVPVIAFIEHPSESAFSAALAAGANDAVVVGDVNGIVRRVSSLSRTEGRARPPKHHGVAVIASADVPKRRQLGRTLRQAGFEIAFAAAPEELRDASRGPVPPTLVVATQSFAPQGMAAAGLGAMGASAVQTVVLSGNASATAGGSAATDTTGELLFRAEEALRAGGEERRASRRIHFATVCGFRRAGDLQPTFGLTHNLSAGGMYVRTLDVPSVGTTLWMELRLPYTNQTVHLRAEVVSATAAGSGTARPAGFGVKVLAGHCPPADLGAFLTAYNELANRNPALSN